MELRKTAHLLAHQFIIKGYTAQGWRDGRGTQGKVHGKGCRCAMPSSGVPPPGTSPCAPTWKLQPFGLGFLWRFPYAGVIYSIIGYLVTESIFNPSPLPRGKREAESSNPWLVSLATSPLPSSGAFQKLPH